jgi:hypothetical protein
VILLRNFTPDPRGKILIKKAPPPARFYPVNAWLLREIKIFLKAL